MKAVTLLYHDVIEDGDFGYSGPYSPDANYYKLDKEEFIAHLDAIDCSSDKPAQDLTELHQGGCLNTCHFITFDDGGKSFLTPIADLLDQRGWKGLFFISTDFIDTKGFLSTEDIQTLTKRGHVIGSHSCSHPLRMSDLPYHQILNEWRNSKEILEHIIAQKVETASVPGGFLSPEIERAAAEAGFKSLFTSEPKKTIYRVGNCLIIGRYSIAQGTSARKAGQLSSQSLSFAQLYQFFYWNIKKIVKRYCRTPYNWLRLKMLSSFR